MNKKLDLNSINSISTSKLEDKQSIKNRGGRPRKITDKIDKKLTIYITNKELETIRNYCDENDITVSAFTRNTIMKKINNSLK